jgi:hypothetical protein
MKRITLILMPSLLWLLAFPSLHITDAYSQETFKQTKQPQSVVDEILQACGPLFFEHNSSELGAGGEPCLIEISLNLQLADNYYLVVDMHRASSETDDISMARAKNARDYLVKEKKIKAGRLIMRNYKDSCPHEMDQEKLNSRLEFFYWREKDNVESILKRCANGAKPSFVIIE